MLVLACEKTDVVDYGIMCYISGLTITTWVAHNDIVPTCSHVCINHVTVVYFRFDYYNVSRTLCPLEHEHKHSGMEVQQIIADVSSSSELPTKFVLEAVYIEDFELT